MINNPAFILLKEKIAKSSDFTPSERDFILEVLNLNDYRERHTYPPNFKPSSNVWAKHAWAILDSIKPSAMTVSDRYQLSGMVAGALMEMWELGRRHKKPG